MYQLNKLLFCISKDSEIFKKTNIGFIVGLTNTQIKELKKYAISNNLITEKQRCFYLTQKAEKYLKTNPIQKWADETYFKRPEINLEYLKLEKMPPIVTKAIRCLSKHLLSNEQLKQNSTEDYIFQEIILSDNCKELKTEIQDIILSNKKIKIADIFNKYLNAPYGLTKSLISVLLLNAISTNINKIAVYEKGQFLLNLDYLAFDRMVCCCDNFELKKTVADDNNLLWEISGLLLQDKTNNILDITKGLYRFIKNLDKYVLNTERLSKPAIRFKNIVLNAKDPISLFYRDIPKVLLNKQLIECDETFIDAFNNVLIELKTAKDNLSVELLKFTLDAFYSKTRHELSNRFVKVQQYISDKELKILSNNILKDDCDDILWIDRIATFINTYRVPKDWCDSDIADYKVKLKELALKYEVIESVAGDINAKLSDSIDSLLKQVLKLPKQKKNIFLRKVINN